MLTIRVKPRWVNPKSSAACAASVINDPGDLRNRLGLDWDSLSQEGVELPYSERTSGIDGRSGCRRTPAFNRPLAK